MYLSTIYLTPILPCPLEIHLLPSMESEKNTMHRSDFFPLVLKNESVDMTLAKAVTFATIYLCFLILQNPVMSFASLIL